MRIDSHQHFWKFDPVRDSWINDDMKVIQRDFFPTDLERVLAQNNFSGCVAVQAGQSEKETDFLVSLATEYDFVKGVVGWADLQAEDIAERLAHYKAFPVVKGFRHVLQGEAQRDLMLSPNFIRGIAALQEFDFTYDILIFPDQLIYSKSLAAQFPEQKFVLDHLGKPNIREKEIKEWTLDIEALSKLPNVWCKVSGMVTEAEWNNWKQEDFKQYLDVIVETFGVDRIMFGSDWPVCLVAANYRQVVNIVENYFSTFSKDEQEKVFGLNAKSFYNL